MLGSGPILRYVIEAADILSSKFDISSEVWSITSYGELRRNGMEMEREKRLNPNHPHTPYVAECFGDDTPTVAASDYISAVPEMIQRWVGGRYIVLGTDGFGRSDTREALRSFFEIDTKNIVLAAISALEQEGRIATGTVDEVIDQLGIERKRVDKTR